MAVAPHAVVLVVIQRAFLDFEPKIENCVLYRRAEQATVFKNIMCTSEIRHKNPQMSSPWKPNKISKTTKIWHTSEKNIFVLIETFIRLWRNSVRARSLLAIPNRVRGYWLNKRNYFDHMKINESIRGNRNFPSQNLMCFDGKNEKDFYSDVFWNSWRNSSLIQSLEFCKKIMR